MRKLEASRPSPVFVLAVLALVAAFAGTAIAGPDAISKINKSKVKTIANKQINKAAPDLSVENADKLGGDPANAYLKSTGVRFVKINGDGTIDASLSKGVTQANVNRESPGIYCIDGLDPAPRSAQITVDWSGPYQAQFYALLKPTTSFCTNKQVAIRTYVGLPTAGPPAADMPTYVTLFD